MSEYTKRELGRWCKDVRIACNLFKDVSVVSAYLSYKYHHREKRRKSFLSPKRWIKTYINDHYRVSTQVGINFWDLYLIRYLDYKYKCLSNREKPLAPEEWDKKGMNTTNRPLLREVEVSLECAKRWRSQLEEQYKFETEIQNYFVFRNMCMERNLDYVTYEQWLCSPREGEK